MQAGGSPPLEILVNTQIQRGGISPLEIQVGSGVSDALLRERVAKLEMELQLAEMARLRHLKPPPIPLAGSRNQTVEI